MTHVERIPTAAEIAARRARLGYVTAKPVWNRAPAKRQEPDPLARVLAAYHCVVDTTAALYVPRPLSMQTPVKRVRRAVRLIARIWGVSVDDIMGPSRTKHIVAARHAAFYMAAKLTKWSLPKIGRAFDGKDHTTVLYGVRKIVAATPRRSIDFRGRGQ